MPHLTLYDQLGDMPISGKKITQDPFLELYGKYHRKYIFSGIANGCIANILVGKLALQVVWFSRSR